MRSALPKVLHELCGRSMLGHVLDVAGALDPSAVAVVLAPETIDAVRAHLGEQYIYVLQAQRQGTGHAVLQARPALAGRSSEVLVLFGDTPLLRPSTVRKLLELRREQGALLGLLSFEADPPTGYGRVLRDDQGAVRALVEERDATPAQRQITEVNSGVFCFDASWLWPTLDRLTPSPVKGEYYLTDMVALAIAERGAGAVVALPADDPQEAWGVNDRAQLAQASAVLRERVLLELMRSGVTVLDPRATYVDVGVSVGAETTILPGTILRGATRVGAGCEIGPYTTLIDALVGDQARVRYALVEGGKVPAGAEVGPFAHVRS